jgi:muconolactone D-isomerase
MTRFKGESRIMLYLVRMDVHIPHGMPAAEADRIKAREKEYSQELQRQGKWQQLHRVVGEYANYSMFDVDSHDELHEILSGLPLFPYLTIKVTALARHPSSIR